MDFLDAVEQLAPVKLLKSSFLAYPIINALHIAAIGTLFGSVLLLDLSVLGRIRSIPRKELVPLLRHVALVAFVFAALTGLTLFSVQATTYVRNPAFLTKLTLILLAVTNFFVFTILDRRTGEATPTWLRVSAIASLLLWSSVLLAGRFIGFA
jgi:hypothetical protein